MTLTAKCVRRVVAGEDETGKAVVFSDAASPDVRTDAARPGFFAARLWVTDATPARTRGVRETLQLPHTLEPPPRGSVFRYVEFPPDDSYRGKVGPAEVAAWFRSMGSPGASRYSPSAPHPYMQKTRSVDVCHVLEGEIYLVLDTEEVLVCAGDTVIQRGTSHAWSNRSSRPCVMAISSHDAAAGGDA
jgi:mannose-6-phosphate isomerase-like protein (cupin superfamily)